ncbi:unnamed protein product [Spirodela intermedia]|uniref:Uncharacterized protein n=2 Tax=Spirodela intermedia TaxID=51605 RepID=A0A7I8KXZ2_SPIIN|nr:unnamed protein product [Spirodela intermedia]CAA6665909.1 unnamed protein product [Spirodela intermedia]CAA7402673.1 unnamed protein product [Spirodela intermedia]
MYKAASFGFDFRVIIFV